MTKEMGCLEARTYAVQPPVDAAALSKASLPSTSTGVTKASEKPNLQPNAADEAGSYKIRSPQQSVSSAGDTKTTLNGSGVDHHRQQQQQHQSGQGPSVVTFDDLLPLLTSQHRTPSGSSDALMELYDAFTKQGLCGSP